MGFAQRKEIDRGGKTQRLRYGGHGGEGNPHIRIVVIQRVVHLAVLGIRIV
jgi:hypothetical protein